MYSKKSDSFEFNKIYINNKDFKPILKSDANLNKKFEELGLDGNKQKELLDFINYKNIKKRDDSS
jgi:adenine-specific DNA-methyltransferase